MFFRQEAPRTVGPFPEHEGGEHEGDGGPAHERQREGRDLVDDAPPEDKVRGEEQRRDDHDEDGQPRAAGTGCGQSRNSVWGVNLIEVASVVKSRRQPINPQFPDVFPMSNRSCLSIVLAAGEGTRMKSALPKVLHPVAGLSMLAHVVHAVEAAGGDQVAVVIGHGGEAVKAAAEGFCATGTVLRADGAAWHRACRARRA